MRKPTTLGGGAPCPVDPQHGPLMRHAEWGGRLYCPHSDHVDSAGRFFTEAEASGADPVGATENEKAHRARLEEQVYEQAAKAILAGQSTREAEVADIAKAKKIGKAAAGEKLDAAIAEQKAAARQAPERKAQQRAAVSAPRQRLEQVAPAEFAKLRDELGLTNKECAAANAEAGLGSTLSRITELTHSKGASTAIFDKVKAAWTSYAETLKKEGKPR